MNKFINAISIENYRGIKDEQTIDLADSGSMTFLVGQNNSGKTLVSKVLSIVNRISPVNNSIPIIQFDNTKFIDSEFYNLMTENAISIRMSLNFKAVEQIIKKQLPHTQNSLENYLRAIEKLTLNIKIQKKGNQYVAFSFLSDNTRDSFIYNSSTELFEFNNDYKNAFGIPLDFVKLFTSNIIEHLKEAFLIFSPIRSFYPNETPFNTGSELLPFLEDEDNESETMVLKNRVGVYLQKLNLDVPSNVIANINRKHLKFTFKNNLPLTSQDVGTGYSMVYILLMEIFRNKKKVIVIDEIESHLHPGLIRELIKILREIGDGLQFIIATHSPTVMEAANDKDHLYHFQKNEDKCIIRKFYKGSDSNKGLRTVGNDLGIIPGDALLSNCVIWVEGPSEILWLRAWMKAYSRIYLSDNKIRNVNVLEGLHYSILMTGGTLIKHIDFDEENATIEDIEDDFGLNVLRINPNPFVMIDSDNSSQSSAKFVRCLKIANELHRQNKTARWNKLNVESISGENIYNVQNLWFLKGRELENYCHPDILEKFYKSKSIHTNSNIKGIANVTDWDVFSNSDGVGKILENRGLKGIKKKSGTIIHKIDLATFVFREFSEIHFNEEPLEIKSPNKEMIKDLTNNMNKLFDYIFEVNNLK